MFHKPLRLAAPAIVACLLGTGFVQADDKAGYQIHSFSRQQLTDDYLSEGIAAGDLNKDGHEDIVYGPYWFAGPKFTEKHEIYPPKSQNREGYADHFFAWVRDFNGDGWNDILTAGFPGTPGFLYENPGAAGHGKHWPKHQILNSVGNESPQFVNIVGDETPELVCSNDGFNGYATFDPKRPFEPWTFHAVSEQVAPKPFGHGLGVGDVNGDKRMDVLVNNGWFEQPAELADGKTWAFHAVPFAAGGADMFAYDVDGDGDNDVITSLNAHEFGLAWHEQAKDGSFKRHLIMGDRPADNRYGVLFTEPHSVQLADIDGDGLKDIITGKTYYSHHKGSPLWDAGAVVYWFKLTRTPEGVDFVPFKADGEAGIGRQLVVHDINKDGLPDLASGGMKGAHLLIHHRENVDKARWQEHQPKVLHTEPAPEPIRGTPAKPDGKTGRVQGAIEAEALTVLGTTGGKAGTQEMAGFGAKTWSGDSQLFWGGANPGDKLDLEFNAPAAGEFDVLAAFTMARDYATVQVLVDGQPVGKPLDLYNSPDVISSGEFNLGASKLTAGKHKLTLEIKGANPSAVPAYMVGLDYLRLQPR